MSQISPLGNVILTIFVPDTDPQEVNDKNKISTKKKVTAAKILGIGIAFMGRVGYIPLSIAAGKGNKAYGNWLAFCSVTGFAAFYSWTNIKIIDDFTVHLTDDEQALLPRQDSQKANGVKYVVAFVGGVVSLLPLIYITVQVNDGNWGYGVMSLIADVSLPTLSLRQSLVLPSSKQILSDAEEELEATRKSFLNQLQQALLGIQRFHRGSGKDVLLRKIADTPTDLNTVLKLVDSLKDKSVIQVNSRKTRYFMKGVDCAWLAWGGVTAFSSLALFYLSTIAAINTWRGEAPEDSNGEPNLKKSWLGHISAAGVCAVNTVLILKSSVNGARRLGSRFAQLTTGHYQPTIEEQLMPKVAIISNLMGALIAAFAYGPTSVLAVQYFSRFHVEGFMQVSLPFGMALLIINATQDVTNDIIRAKVLHGGDKVKKETLQLYIKLELLSRYVKHSPLVEFAKFLGQLSDSELALLTENIETTKASLDKALESTV